MPINFLEPGCQTVSGQPLFGLCDRPDPAKDPAYIDESNRTDWIAEVHNPQSLPVEFFAVDHCPGVEPTRSNGEKSRRCDGILRFANNLRFIELKDRDHRGWISGGRKQLTETIEFYQLHHNDLDSFEHVDAYIANKQRPSAVVSIITEIQKFKDDTALLLNNKGLLLSINRNILL